MSDRLEQAIAVARKLPTERRDEIAAMVMFYAERSVVRLTTEEEADLAEAEAEVARGELATDEEMAQLWAKYGP